MSTTAYPVHVEAQREPGLSRWPWLVKRLLVLPHFIVVPVRAAGRRELT